MQETYWYKDFVPVIAALIGGIIGGAFAVIGGIVAGRFNRSNMQLQLEHQKTEEIRKLKLQNLEELFVLCLEFQRKMYVFSAAVTQATIRVPVNEVNEMTAALFENLSQIEKNVLIYAESVKPEFDVLINSSQTLHKTGCLVLSRNILNLGQYDRQRITAMDANSTLLEKLQDLIKQQIK